MRRDERRHLNDTYVVDNVGDTVTDAAGIFGGIDLVQSSITIPSLDADVENLTLTGVAAINGTGNGLNNVDHRQRRQQHPQRRLAGNIWCSAAATR